MNRTLSFVLVVFSCSVSASTALHQPPADFLDDKPLRVIRHVSEIPRSLHSSLAKLFKERSLRFAESGTPIQDEFIIDGHGKDLPTRRFLFAFETSKYYCAYIERGPPAVCAYAIIFEKQTDSLVFRWTGADLDSPIAKSVNDLRKRIANGDLLPHDPRIW